MSEATVKYYSAVPSGKIVLPIPISPHECRPITCRRCGNDIALLMNSNGDFSHGVMSLRIKCSVCRQETELIFTSTALSPADTLDLIAEAERIVRGEK
jgi:hypothetical protein